MREKYISFKKEALYNALIRLAVNISASSCALWIYIYRCFKKLPSTHKDFWRDLLSICAAISLTSLYGLFKIFFFRFRYNDHSSNNSTKILDSVCKCLLIYAWIQAYINTGALVLYFGVKDFSVMYFAIFVIFLSILAWFIEFIAEMLK